MRERDFIFVILNAHIQRFFFVRAVAGAHDHIHRREHKTDPNQSKHTKTNKQQQQEQRNV